MQYYIKGLLISIALILNTPAMAFKCYITLMKSKCWDKHTVKLSVIDNKSEATILKNIILNKKTLWARKEFECSLGQGLITQASFTPHIWDAGENKEYHTTRIWFLPLEPGKRSVAWNVPICFPNDFSEVPLLPNVDKACDCDSTKEIVTPLPKPSEL